MCFEVAEFIVTVLKITQSDLLENEKEEKINELIKKQSVKLDKSA